MKGIDNLVFGQKYRDLVFFLLLSLETNTLILDEDEVEVPLMLCKVYCSVYTAVVPGRAWSDGWEG